MTSMLLWPATHEWQSSDRCLAMQTNHDQQPYTYLQTLSHHHSKHTDNMYGDVYSEWCLGFSTNQLVSPILNRRATLNPPLCKSMRTAVLHWDWLQQLFIHITGLILSTQVACCLTTAGQHYATWLWSRTPSLSTKILIFLLLCGQQLWRCHLCLQPPSVIRDWVSVYCASSSWWAQSTFLLWIQTTSVISSIIILLSGGHFTHDVNCSLSGKLEAASCNCYTGQILWIVISWYWYW